MQQNNSLVKIGSGLLMVILIFVGFGFHNIKSKSNEYISVDIANQLNDNRLTGKELFKKNCAACHDLERQGNPPTFPSLIDINQRRDKDEVTTLLLTGGKIMPKFSHLSDSGRVAIVAYLFGKIR